jgi:hypothetical protein
VKPDSYSLEASAAKGLRAVIFETDTFTRAERIDIFHRANIATNDLAFLAQVEPHLDRILWHYDKSRCLEYMSGRVLTGLKRRLAVRFRQKDEIRTKEVVRSLEKGEITPKEAISALRGISLMPESV